MTQCYAFPGKNEAEASNEVIIGTILVCDRIANVLFDMGSTYSYVSMTFSSNFEMLYLLLITLYVFLQRWRVSYSCLCVLCLPNFSNWILDLG